jgi:hypothetical protein
MPAVRAWGTASRVTGGARGAGAAFAVALGAGGGGDSSRTGRRSTDATGGTAGGAAEEGAERVNAPVEAKDSAGLFSFDRR